MWWEFLRHQAWRQHHKKFWENSSKETRWGWWAGRPENTMDRGAWQATVTKSWTRLSDWTKSMNTLLQASTYTEVTYQTRRLPGWAGSRFNVARLVPQLAKNLPPNTGGARDAGSIPESGRSPEGNGPPLQYSCLENPKDRGAWLVRLPSMGL